MRYLIEHETHLTFPEPVREHHCELRLVPRDQEEQRVHRVRIAVEPAAELFSYIDYYGNVVDHFSVIEGHERLLTRIELDVETLLGNPFDYEPVDPRREPAWVAEALHAQPRFWDFVLHRSAATPELAPLASEHDLPHHNPERPLLESVQRAMAWIRSSFDYDPDVTHVHTTLAEVLALRGGVCQDFAHLLVTLVRWWGYPARYVVGYQDPGYRADGDEVVRPATHA